VLNAVDEAHLCDGCAATSARIDQFLATTDSNDPVFCDGCKDRVTFDARVAVVVRECGSGVVCDDCKPTALERTSA